MSDKSGLGDNNPEQITPVWQDAKYYTENLVTAECCFKVAIFVVDPFTS